MTLFLHGAFDGDRFLLWGEVPPQRAHPVRKPRGRKPKVPPPPSSPFDPGAEALRDALAAVDGGIGDIAVAKAVLWLPSAAKRPLPSSPLIEEPSRSDAATTSAPWTVTVLALRLQHAIDLLCRCVDTKSVAPGVFVSDDLAFWSAAMRFAGALVAQGSVLPDLVETDGAFQARWRPLVTGNDVAVEAGLAAAMPDSCRAGGSAVSPPDLSRATLLHDFVAAVADTLVRAAAAPPPARIPDTTDDRWLEALCGPDPRVHGSAEELGALRRRCAEWRRPVAVVHGGPLRLCFRLDDPPHSEDGEDDEDGPWSGADGEWTIRQLVQSSRDPSLLVPAAEAWNAPARVAAAFAADTANIREFLLSSLGRAARLCPFVEESLRGSLSGGCETDTAGAVAFLTEHALALEQAGFGVMLPAWWTNKGTKVRLTARAHVKAPKMQGGGGISLDEMVRFDWQVALGDTALSREELMELARLKAPLVRVRGQWVLLDGAEIREAIALLKQKKTGFTGRDVVRIALGGADGADSLAAGGVEALDWITGILERLGDRETIEPLPCPGGFVGSLRPYQERGYAWLGFLRRWGLGACLADDMGLGKTIQTLALILRDRETAETRQPVLLICPTSVIGNWQREAARFTPELAVMVHHGGTRSRGTGMRRKAFANDVVITSYALLQRDIKALGAIPWKGVVLDEAQNIKNPETKQAQAARAIEAEYRLALTGTPVENNVGDLWSIMEFLNPGFLGSQAEFKRRFFVPIQAGRDAAAIARLKSLTTPFIMRRLKTDRSIIADLPEKMEMKVFCNLTPEQASLYTAVAEEAIAALDSAEGIQRKGVVLATLSKLKQVCNHPLQFLGDNSSIAGRSGKLARLTEMLEEALGAGDRALVFTQFAEMGNIIKSHLQGTFGEEVPFLHGGVPKAKRDAMVTRFQEETGPPVFLLSLKAGGTGLNLTAANRVFHFDRWWNPAVEDQATDRAFRIGQTRQVQVHKFLCAGTLEDKIDEMIEKKKEVASAVVGTGEAWLTEFTTEQLRDILTLGAEAVTGTEENHDAGMG